MNAPSITTAGQTQAVTRKFDLSAALRDSFKTALIMLGLSIPILAYKTDQSGADLYLTPRWGLVAIICAIVFGLRLALHAFTASRSYRQATPSSHQATEPVHAEPSAFQHVSKFAIPFFLGVALLFPAIIYLIQGGLNESRYWVDLGILILTYVMLGWGLNIVVGLAGLLDLGYVAFYAVGAYSYALLSTTFGLSFWICLPLAGILAAFWGMILGFPVLRLRGDYLAIVTLAFGEIVRLVLINWVDLTNGGAGISSIPRATFFGIPFTAGEGGFAQTFGLEFNGMHRIIFLYYLILVLALITNFVTMRLRRLPIGRAWEALREDEIACRSLGINTTNTKLTAFAIGAMFGGFAGSFFAVRQGFVSPESFNFLESAIILAIVVLGGMGSQIGVAIAAVVLVGGPEMLRNLTFLQAIFGSGFDPNEYRLLLFGAGMVAMMVWRPRGLISEREPSVILKERKAISGSLVKEGHG
ncbi:high-affinity branched-chain amino acid ABC transporter permease LivM [Microvirga lotononidis]|uniref:ABC-type branched-chain amino acid transport system, permease component n=1 Tax=Microvirga lotononidis TaxID=864069 RepID=I4YNW3_9HYPH|nr:high-affinity branched-chain amino acid ABC transporter permease LivM [Microvirga lotononidis]EIM25655.1 ABC-type branched-chain amino acid transport system, permease component [Microvirga lotononidis]WQO26461.1 high-affinity branched-chain amino acid ABC transporter permease LivM [Microvirga lotononidis]